MFDLIKGHFPREVSTHSGVLRFCHRHVHTYKQSIMLFALSFIFPLFIVLSLYFPSSLIYLIWSKDTFLKRRRKTVCKVSSLCLRCTITVRYLCFYIFINLLVFIFLYFLFSPSLYWISEEDTLYKCTREVKLRQRR